MFMTLQIEIISEALRLIKTGITHIHTHTCNIYIYIQSSYKSLATCSPIPAADVNVVVNSYMFNYEIFYFAECEGYPYDVSEIIWVSNPFLGPCCKSTPCSITSSGANRAQVRSRGRWSGERKQRLLADAVWKTERYVYFSQWSLLVSHVKTKWCLCADKHGNRMYF